ncbi:acyl-CoA reductase [Taibaiella lutea]|uniref:Acyl-CoA reductase n=1 Tax=Taibaiella lutea TaxID=2608001 RepID=A0A5M6CGS4_9BACT|nr:acyl-CoA reductase [Taibaiella lutea]KAA5533112.1 acyl-CoA reductase [Taibaiella lutea]
MSVLAERIALMVRLGQYFSSNDENWQYVKDNAERMNGWFTQPFIELAVQNITTQFLEEDKLKAWLAQYPELPDESSGTRTVGLVMAGNIPLVGFHDFLCCYLSGNNVKVKLSSKDTVLWEYIFKILSSWDEDFAKTVTVSDMLKDCDAYIATGSNNSARYFEQYFKRFPHIIRRNRTSVAVLDGTETVSELEALADDVCLYYGLGCRNVTKIFVPENYDFETLIPVFNKYKDHTNHNKYMNNYDFQLAIFLLNKVQYMTNGSVLLVPGEGPFAAISVLHYEVYKDKAALLKNLVSNDDLQCITTKQEDAMKFSGKAIQGFGDNQQPALADYADGVDTMEFLTSL